MNSNIVFFINVTKINHYSHVYPQLFIIFTALYAFFFLSTLLTTCKIHDIYAKI